MAFQHIKGQAILWWPVYWSALPIITKHCCRLVPLTWNAGCPSWDHVLSFYMKSICVWCMLTAVWVCPPVCIRAYMCLVYAQGCMSVVCGCACWQNSLSDFPTFHLETQSWNLLLHLGYLVIKNFRVFQSLSPPHPTLWLQAPQPHQSFYVGAGVWTQIQMLAQLYSGVLVKALFLAWR